MTRRAKFILSYVMVAVVLFVTMGGVALSIKDNTDRSFIWVTYANTGCTTGKVITEKVYRYNNDPKNDSVESLITHDGTEFKKDFHNFWGWMLPNGTKLYPGQKIPAGFNDHITLEPVFAPWSTELFELVGDETVFKRDVYDALPEEEKELISVPLLGQGKMAMDSFGSGEDATLIYDGLTKIKYIVFPEELIQINDRAFKDLVNLSVVNIPQAVVDRPNTPTINEGVDPSAFKGTNLSYIYVGKESSQYTVNNGVLFSKTSTGRVELIKMVVKRQSYRVPDGTKTIAPYAFEEDNKIQKITFNGDLETIASFAFLNCSGITELVMPVGLTSIHESSFKNCVNLAKVTFNIGFLAIGIESFAGCVKLAGIKLPETLTNINRDAFRGCVGLTGTLVIPDSVAIIQRHVFFGSGIRNIEVETSETPAYSPGNPPKDFEDQWDRWGGNSNQIISVTYKVVPFKALN